jgi:hypothetical protein
MVHFKILAQTFLKVLLRDVQLFFKWNVFVLFQTFSPLLFFCGLFFLGCTAFYNFLNCIQITFRKLLDVVCPFNLRFFWHWSGLLFFGLYWLLKSCSISIPLNILVLRLHRRFPRNSQVEILIGIIISVWRRRWGRGYSFFWLWRWYTAKLAFYERLCKWSLSIVKSMLCGEGRQWLVFCKLIIMVIVMIQL